MSGSEFHHYTRDEFLAEFYPDPDDKAAIAAGMEQLRALVQEGLQRGLGYPSRRRWSSSVAALGDAPRSSRNRCRRIS
jgi:hypothetical protein